MTLEHIAESYTLPTPETTDDWKEWAIEFRRELTRILGTVHARAINDLTIMNPGGAWYSATANETTGDFPEGTWRIKIDDNGKLVREKYVSGIWTLSSRENI